MATSTFSDEIRHQTKEISQFEKSIRLPDAYRQFLLDRPTFKVVTMGDGWSWVFRLIALDEVASEQSKMMEFFEWGDDDGSHVDDNAPLKLQELWPIAKFKTTHKDYQSAVSSILLSADGSLYAYTQDHSEIWDGSTFEITTPDDLLETELAADFLGLMAHVDKCVEEGLPLIP